MASGNGKKKRGSKRGRVPSKTVEKVSLKANRIQAVWRGLDEIGSSRLPIGLTVKVLRAKKAVEEYLNPLEKEMKRIFDEHAVDGVVPSGTKAHKAFQSSLKPVLEEVFDVNVTPLVLSELVGAPGVVVSEQLLGVLLVDGIVVDDT